MKSVLIASMCLAYDPAGDCVDRQEWLSGVWQGAEAPIQCDEELAASPRRLKQEGYERMFELRCETAGGGE
jgi:hypothetical protein